MPSAAILRAVRREKVELLRSVPLGMEYEALCLTKTEHQLAAGLSEQEVHIFLDAVIAMAEPVKIHFLWDPAIAGSQRRQWCSKRRSTDARICWSRSTERDYGTVLERFGIQVTTPRRAMERIGK